MHVRLIYLLSKSNYDPHWQIILKTIGKHHTNTHSYKAPLHGHHQVFPFITNESRGSFPDHERYKANCIALDDNPYFCLAQCVRVIFGNVSWLFLMACIFIMSWFYILQPQTDFLQLQGHNHGQFTTHQGLLMHFHISITYRIWCSRCH